MSVKVIRFAPGLRPVIKHEQHDQATHGSWANGTSESSLISTDTQIAFNEGAIKATDNILSPSAYKSQLEGNLNRTYPKTYLEEAVNNPTYQDALQTHLKSIGFPETVKVFSNSAQEGEYFHGSVAPLWDSGAVGYESEEPRKEFSVNRSDIIGLGKVADSGVWFRNSKAVQKHLPGGHEQKDHGSWAVGGGIGHLSESTAKEIEESTALFQDLMGADVDIKNTLTGYGWESEENWETLNNRLINRYMESGLGKNTAILQARIDMGRVGYAMKNADEKANYEETITKNRERAVLMGDEYAQSYGQEADQMEKGLAYAKEQVTNAMKNGDVTIAMSEYVLDSVLVGGRYKNQFETRTSGGKLDVGVRKVGEGLATGTPAGTKLADRPVYGYLTNNETVHTYESKRDAVKALEGEWSDKHTLDRTLDWQSTTSVNNYRVDQYGDIRVILKSDVRGRTTVTIGDSLRTGVMADGMSNPKPDLTNMGLYKAGAASHMSGNPTAGYLEAQIHGGVKVSDISRIYAPRDRVESIELSLSMRGLDIPVIARKES